jgi:hypothetical protein
MKEQILMIRDLTFGSDDVVAAEEFTLSVLFKLLQVEFIHPTHFRG